MVAKLKIIDKVKNDPGLKQKPKVQSRFKNPNSGAVYVSHLPHGFYEYQLRNFFKQFGTVLRVSVLRSEQTSQPCGYGYVHFESGEVAQIAAETMDDYLMRGKILQCQYVPFEKIVPRKMFPPVTSEATCPAVLKRKDAIGALNKSGDRVRKIRIIKKTYAMKLQRLQKAGIKFDIDLIDKSEPKVESEMKGAKEGKKKNTKDTKEEVKTEVNGNGVKEIKPKKLRVKKKLQKMNVAKKEEMEVTGTAVGEESGGATETMKEESEMVELKKLVQEGTPGNKKRKVEDSEELDESKVGKVGSKGNKKKTVVEVDESDDEIQFKTPPNMVKKFVRITPSSPACRSSGTTDSPNASNGSQTKEKTEQPLMKTLFKQKNKVPTTPKAEGEVEIQTPQTVQLTPGVKKIKKAKSPGTPATPKPVLKEVEAETPQNVTNSAKKAKKVKTPSTSVGPEQTKPETPQTVNITPGATPKPVLKEVEAETPQNVTNSAKKAKKVKTPSTSVGPEQTKPKEIEPETPQTVNITPGIKKAKKNKTPGTPGQKVKQTEEKATELETPQIVNKTPTADKTVQAKEITIEQSLQVTPGVKKAKKAKTPGTPATNKAEKVKTPKTPLTVKADQVEADQGTPLKRKQSDDDLKAKTLFKKLKAATLKADDMPSDSPQQTPKKGKTPVKKDKELQTPKEESNLQAAENKENSESPNEEKTPKTPKVKNTPKTPKGKITPKTPKGKITPKTPKGKNTPKTPKGKKTPKTPKEEKTPNAISTPSMATTKVKKFGKTKKIQSMTPAPQKKKAKILKPPKSV